MGNSPPQKAAASVPLMLKPLLFPTLPQCAALWAWPSPPLDYKGLLRRSHILPLWIELEPHTVPGTLQALRECI